MEWGGKLVGGLAGALLGGPVGAAVGAWVGHLALDRRDSEAPESVRARVFRVTFEVMGCLAKSDGRVSEQDIAAARAMMDEFALGPEARRAAILAYTRGKQPDYAWSAAVMGLRRACAGRADVLGVFLDIQMRVAWAGSDLAPPVRARLLRIATMLGVGESAFAALEARVRGASSAAGAARLSLAQAYAVLGVAPEVGDRELERAYRRQLSQHHPDKLQSRGVPEALLAHAAARTRDILEAWDVIREHRGIDR